MKRKAVQLLGILLALTLSGITVQSQQTDPPDKPGGHEEINVTSGGGSVSTKGKTIEFTFQPRVSVVWGTTNLTCDKLVIVRWREGNGKSVDGSTGVSRDSTSPLARVRTVTASGNLKLKGRNWTATSSKGTYSNEESTALLNRPVNVQWEAMKAKCDRLVIVLDRDAMNERGGASHAREDQDGLDAVRSAVASGNVRVRGEGWLATAGKAVYSRKEKTITFTEGPPRFWQGPVNGKAEKIVYHVDETRFELFGSEPIPIETTINPRGRKEEKSSRPHEN